MSKIQNDQCEQRGMKEEVYTCAQALSPGLPPRNSNSFKRAGISASKEEMAGIEKARRARASVRISPKGFV
ncbi:hypothetical protein Clacol_004426 [Clathrus columnatus]|uniref:Uncharacterized protein n=1 Tax=Clathrus columnatus TaxID=1419009 RepID=A0AAV5A7E4_9AGAM|nr:hypothetical protein Clacol_004426 [Clathrus columnatus]